MMRSGITCMDTHKLCEPYNRTTIGQSCWPDSSASEQPQLCCTTCWGHTTGPTLTQSTAVPEPRPEKLGKFCKIPTVRRVQGPRRALKLNLPRCPEGQGKSERERKESAPKKAKCESRMWSARITVVCGCVRSARSDLHTSEFSHLRICCGGTHKPPHTR